MPEDILDTRASAPVQVISGGQKRGESVVGGELGENRGERRELKRAEPGMFLG